MALSPLCDECVQSVEIYSFFRLRSYENRKFRNIPEMPSVSVTTKQSIKQPILTVNFSDVFVSKTEIENRVCISHIFGSQTRFYEVIKNNLPHHKFNFCVSHKRQSKMGADSLILCNLSGATEKNTKL